jgi:hypothetical protein
MTDTDPAEPAAPAASCDCGWAPAPFAGGEPSPYLTVGGLRELTEGWPDDRPILISGYEGGLSRVVYACHELVQELGGRPDYLGAFEKPADAQRAATEPPDGPWAVTDPPTSPPTLVGEPIMALVLRRGWPYGA